MAESPKTGPGALPGNAMPEIVGDRLRTAKIMDQAHPDASLLTAFVEQALSVSERHAMLAHLAICGGCRDVVALALPNVEGTDAAAAREKTVAPEEFLRKQPTASNKLSFARPALRWVALAAAVLVAGAVLLVRPGTLNQLTLRSANQPVAPTSNPQIASSSVPTSVPTSFPAVAGKESETTARQATKRPAHRSAEPSAEDTLMAANHPPADNSLPIERAKPASPETKMEPSELQDATQPSIALPGRIGAPSRATWSIASGDLQRSFDSGQTWQSALHTDRPLLCYSGLGADLWTGGQTGTLFHSNDGGITWIQSHPAVNGQPLTSDISHIDIQSSDTNTPASITLSTSDNEIWNSPDGGKTWQKK
jgi:hypothetical protein